MKFGLVWCIDGNQRSVVFDMEDADKNIPYKRYYSHILNDE